VNLALVRPVRGTLLTAVGLQALSAGLALLPLVTLIAFTAAWLTGGPAPASPGSCSVASPT
jgi:hypothetical protein